MFVSWPGSAHVEQAIIKCKTIGIKRLFCGRNRPYLCAGLGIKRKDLARSYPSVGLASAIDHSISHNRKAHASWLFRHMGWLEFPYQPTTLHFDCIDVVLAFAHIAHCPVEARQEIKQAITHRGDSKHVIG